MFGTLQCTKVILSLFCMLRGEYKNHYGKVSEKEQHRITVGVTLIAVLGDELLT